MAKELRIARLPPGHGRHIYAYCNVRTNQVLYSLQRILRNTHLKQLADAGANNNPPKLRKDQWRPLYTVTLPDSPDGYRQGLQLFRHLREYRMLHETSWELPEEIKRPYTEKEIEAMQEKLDDRGGSKKETVYDIIKREKWKMRAKMVMNQKANSIADLAQILLRQEDAGAKIAAYRAVEAPLKREHDVKMIVELAARRGQGGMAELADRIEKLKVEEEEYRAKSKNGGYKRKERKSFSEHAMRVQNQIADTRLHIRRMNWCAEVVENVQFWVRTLADIQYLAARVPDLDKELLEAEDRLRDTELPSREQETAYQEARRMRRSAYREARRMRRIIEDINFHIERTKWIGLDPTHAKKRARLVRTMTQTAVQGWESLVVNKDKARDGGPELKRKRNFAKELAAKHSNNWVFVGIEARLAGEHAGESEIQESAREQQIEAGEAGRILANVAKILSEQPETTNDEATAGVAAGQISEETTETAGQISEETTEKSTAEKSEMPEYHAFLPDFPPELDIADKDQKNKLKSPIYTADGVTVKWSNILDAEFAELWPERIRHEALGFARYTAPKPDARPKDKSSSYMKDSMHQAKPAAYGDSVVEASAAAEAQGEERQKMVDEIKRQLLHRAIAKAEAPPIKRQFMDKKWASRDAARLMEKQMESSEPPTQDSAPNL